MKRFNRIREISDRYGQVWTLATDELGEWYALLSPDSRERDIAGPFDSDEAAEDHVFHL